MNVSKAARMLQSLRKTRAGGRPVVLRPCPKCDKPFGARAMRKHLPKCGKGK